jgi:DNA-binding MltR family transcriptional regulator
MANKPPKPENKTAAPRFKKRGDNDQTVAGSADPIRDSAAIGAELKAQTDRGAAIIAGSVLDQLLKNVIEARLLSLDKKQQNALFGRMAPLSTFSAKIEIGFAIGIYPIVAYRQLKMIQKVRNEFAHRIEAIKFDHPEIMKIINHPDRKRSVMAASAVKPRDEFLVTFSLLTVMLYSVMNANIRLHTLQQTHPTIFSEASAMVRQIVELVRQEQAANRGQDTPTPRT